MFEVSVIIPTFNRCELLREAIESIQKQTLTNIEIIIVDDGSTDETAAMVRCIDDSRVKYFYKTNGGPGSARNTGLLKASGKYVAFLDSDDLWTPEYLETMVRQLDLHPDYGLAYTTLIQLYPDGRTVKDYRSRYCVSGQVTSALWEKAFVPPPAAIVRRTSLSSHFFDESLALHEDGDFFLRLSLQTHFLFVPTECVLRRVQVNSVSQQNGGTRLDTDKVRVFERFYFDLGGDRWITKKRAFRRLARMYARMAGKFYNRESYSASRYLYSRSLAYNRFFIPALYGLLKIRAANLKKDSDPDWKFPPPLNRPITHAGVQ